MSAISSNVVQYYPARTPDGAVDPDGTGNVKTIPTWGAVPAVPFKSFPKNTDLPIATSPSDNSQQLLALPSVAGSLSLSVASDHAWKIYELEKFSVFSWNISNPEHHRHFSTNDSFKNTHLNPETPEGKAWKTDKLKGQFELIKVQLELNRVVCLQECNKSIISEWKLALEADPCYRLAKWYHVDLEKVPNDKVNIAVIITPSGLVDHMSRKSNLGYYSGTNSMTLVLGSVIPLTIEGIERPTMLSAIRIVSGSLKLMIVNAHLPGNSSQNTEKGVKALLDLVATPAHSDYSGLFQGNASYISDAEEHIHGVDSCRDWKGHTFVCGDFNTIPANTRRCIAEWYEDKYSKTNIAIRHPFQGQDKLQLMVVPSPFFTHLNPASHVVAYDHAIVHSDKGLEGIRVYGGPKVQPFVKDLHALLLESE